ncbi:MAG: D-2-hydroxyacid dehydrogenase [Flavobacteriaceae bacterium]|nr:D-2-hydroxyacid dehydrogenase [Flavobacteriaceae bacterium]
MKILANDGISEAGQKALKNEGFTVINQNIPQDQLAKYINQNFVVGLLVRSATTVRKELIDQCPSLRLIGRGGVGMDNIDVGYAKEKEIYIINTPAASSASVAELVFAHLFGGVRFLYDSNRNMPLEGDTKFKKLKKNYSAGIELRGKTLGIVGLGRIGQEVAKIGLGLGMKVIGTDKHIDQISVRVTLFDGQFLEVKIPSIDFDQLLRQSDFITLHVPSQGNPLITISEIKKMKKGSGIINAARGGVIKEDDLLEALDSGQLSFAGLDTYEKEPKPDIKLLMHPRISLSPHIGAATIEAQERIGLELAEQITDLLKIRS